MLQRTPGKLLGNLFRALAAYRDMPSSHCAMSARRAFMIDDGPHKLPCANASTLAAHRQNHVSLV